MKLPENISRLRLGLVINSPNDARSLSRQMGPFTAMARQDPRLEIVLPRTGLDGLSICDWDFFSSCDVVHFLDPFREADLTRIRLARMCGAKVWADFIDDVFSVRRSNPSWVGFANRDQISKVVSTVTAEADIVTCTTHPLRERLPNKERVVILPESCRWPAVNAPRRKLVTWRGMSGHAEDVESVIEAVREVSHLPQFSKWEWMFMGEVPWKLADAVPTQQLITVPVHPPFEWFQLWSQRAPFLHLVPLPDNPFNRSKSCLAWLEATAVGAATIGPNLPEWQNCKGLIRYNDPADFKQVLRKEMEQWDNGKMHPAAIESREDVYPKRTLEAVNEYRWIILNKLCRREEVLT